MLSLKVSNPERSKNARETRRRFTGGEPELIIIENALRGEGSKTRMRSWETPKVKWKGICISWLIWTLKASVPPMTLSRCFGASCAHAAGRRPGLLPRRVPAEHGGAAVPTARRDQGRPRRKPHKLPRAEQTGYTDLQSSQAIIPGTALVAHSLSRGLWAGKYGVVCSHI